MDNLGEVKEILKQLSLSQARSQSKSEKETNIEKQPSP